MVTENQHFAYMTYLLSEANYVFSLFDSFIKEMVNVIILENQKDIFNELELPTGYSWNLDEQKIIKSSEEIYHPIYLRYVWDEETSGVAYVEMRDMSLSEIDKIVININFYRLQNYSGTQLTFLLPTVLAHECRHIRDMWSLAFEEIIKNFSKYAAYTIVSKETLLQYGLDKKIPIEDIRSVETILYMMSAMEVDANIDAIDYLIRSTSEIEIAEIVKNGSDIDEMSNILIDYFGHQSDKWWFTKLELIKRTLWNAVMLHNNKLGQLLLFTQFAIKSGFVKDYGVMGDFVEVKKFYDKPGVYKMTSEIGAQCIAAYNAFCEMTEKFFSELKESVMAALKDMNIRKYIHESYTREKKILLNRYDSFGFITEMYESLCVYSESQDLLRDLYQDILGKGILYEKNHDCLVLESAASEFYKTHTKILNTDYSGFGPLTSVWWKKHLQ